MKTNFNVQFNIMEGLEQVRKKDFIRIFVEKYPKVKPKSLEDQLTLVNRDYKILLYHNKGFIFDWGELVHDNLNWGRYISSFNIDDPSTFATIGGLYQYKCTYGPCPDEIHAIHPNIYRKSTYLKLPTVKRNTIIKICLQNYDIVKYVSESGNIYGAIQICQNMFNIVKKGEALWDGFKFKKCPICDEQITYDMSKCLPCQNLG